MDTLEALVLGLIQGLTEYLPVSSSGHLAIGSAIFDVDPDKNMMFTVLVHVATVLSTLVVLGGQIWKILKGMFSAPAGGQGFQTLSTAWPLIPPRAKCSLAPTPASAPSRAMPRSLLKRSAKTR